MKRTGILIILLFVAAFVAIPITGFAQDDTPPKSEKSSKSKSSKTDKSSTTDKSKKSNSTDKSAKPGKLDLNTASSSELTKLPGVNSEIARKIIAARPFANKAQLKSRDILTEEQYDKITDLVIAKQPKNDADAPKKNEKSKGTTKSKKASEPDE